MPRPACAEKFSARGTTSEQILLAKRSLARVKISPNDFAPVADSFNTSALMRGSLVQFYP
jgi:hypothetical protein